MKLKNKNKNNVRHIMTYSKFSNKEWKQLRMRKCGPKKQNSALPQRWAFADNSYWQSYSGARVIR